MTDQNEFEDHLNNQWQSWWGTIRRQPVLTVYILMLLKRQSPGLNANSQFTNNESRVLRKVNKVYYLSYKKEDRESQPLKALLFHF
jgi:hypothetical protein